MSQVRTRVHPNVQLRKRRRLFFLGFMLVGVLAALAIALYPRLAPVADLQPQTNALPQPVANTADEDHQQSGPESIIPTARLARVPVIMYHDIVPTKQVWFDTTVEEFRAQLEEIRESGATPITIVQLYEHLKNGAVLPERPILLSFDDGYLGHYDHAYPLLKEFNYPAVFFVQTAYVGVKTSKDHMSWEQLQQLDREGLIAIEPHTVTHPEDLRLLSDDSLRQELANSKQVMDQKLGRPVSFLAYPTGNQDARVREAAIAAGYTLAFTMDRGYAGQSPGLLEVQRFNQYRFAQALSGSASVPDSRTTDAPVRLHQGTFRKVKLAWVSGGSLTTNHADGRYPVGTFVEREQAVAGINGGFFAMAALRSNNNEMVGPYLAQNEGTYFPGEERYDTSIRGRPVVLISGTGLRFVPYSPGIFATEAGARQFLGDVSDLFVAGLWLVERGRALSTEQITQFGLTNHSEFRRRAFLGVDRLGRPLVGATLTNVNASQLARSLEAAGVREAVLLDSGFSTSLVYGDKVLVTGHTSPGIPSRIIPHAILVHPPLSAAGGLKLTN